MRLKPRVLGSASGSARKSFPGILTQGTAWYRSDKLITLNGSTVSAWGDLTGNGNTATQGTEANQTTYTQNAIGGKPGLSFVSDDYLSISIAQSLPIYVFAVVDTTNLVGTSYRKILSNNGSGPFFYLGSDGNNMKPSIFWNELSAVWGSALTEKYVVRFRAESGGQTGVKVNTGTEVTDNSSGNATATWNSIGAITTQDPDGAVLSELVILQGSALTDAESDSIINYMMSRYGIS